MDLGRSPNYSPVQNVRVKLSCYYFPSFMVKQYDSGLKGAEWFAIVPASESSLPACNESHGPGEKVIEGHEWGGYFKGVKQNMVFLDAADGEAFSIFDARTAKKIFDDLAYDSTMWNHKTRSGPFNHLRVERAEDGSFRLRYLRVVEADCDLHLEKTECWERVKAKLSLKATAMPVCSGYGSIADRWVSVVAYPVEVSLFPEPVVKVISGPVKCWPVD